VLDDAFSYSMNFVNYSFCLRTNFDLFYLNITVSLSDLLLPAFLMEHLINFQLPTLAL